MPTPLIANSEGRWGSAEALKGEQNVRETQGIRPAMSTLGTNGLSQSELSKLNFPDLVRPRDFDPRRGHSEMHARFTDKNWYGGSTRTGNSSPVGTLDKVSPDSSHGRSHSGTF